MQPPFSADQFFEVFRQYNEGTWPFPYVLYAAALLAVAVVILAPRRSGVVMTILAAVWAWMAVMYHVRFFARINPLAYLFAAMFLFQAAAIVWHGVITRKLELSMPRAEGRFLAGFVLIAYALVAYPVIGFVLGQRYPTLPTFGLPCPTTIFTLGVFLLCARPVPWPLLVVPAVWAVVATSAAAWFGIGEDYALVPAALLVVALMPWSPRRGAAARQGAARA